MPHMPITTPGSRINLNSGKVLDYFCPKPDMIELQDISIPLSRIPRFLGQTKIPFSVAAHSMLAYILAKDEFKASMLFHDAHEAYMGDIPSPLKHVLGSKVKKVEQAIDFAIQEKFSIDLTSDAMIAEKKRVDLLLLEIEYYALHNHASQDKKSFNTSRLIAMIDLLGTKVNEKHMLEALEDPMKVIIFFEYLAYPFIKHTLK
jgi:hypothetical protein